MKIGLVIYGSLASLSGGYLYDRQLVDCLRRQGDTVTVISLPWSRYGRHLTHNFSRRLVQQLLTADFDLLLQDELNHPSLFWINRRLRGRVRYPLVSIVHHLRSHESHPGWQQWLYRQVERRYLDSVAAFIYNSHTTRRAVAGLSPRPRPEIVAPPGGNRFQITLDPQSLPQRTLQAGPLRLLFVGSITPRKGLHTLLAAVARLPADEWTLTVVGDKTVAPGYAGRLQTWVQQAGWSAQISFVGTATGDRLAQTYAQSQLLVVPSQYEGFGIVYLEGMAFGLPAIGSSAGGAKELIKSGSNGYLVTPDDAEALAGHLRQLQARRDLLLELSRNARQSFEQQPTWEESMITIRNFLTELAAIP